MERMIIELSRNKRQRVVIWTPWGKLPAEKARALNLRAGGLRAPSSEREGANTDAAPGRRTRLAS